MEHLNYCRQMAKQFRAMADIQLVTTEMKERMETCVAWAAAAEKFMLPRGGHLIEDSELRALDESGNLRLPFPFVALEYQCQPDAVASRSSTKRIVLAAERESGITFQSVVWMDSVGLFQPYAPFRLENGNYLRRDLIADGVPSLVVRDLHFSAANETTQTERDDCLYEARALLGFINALSCANVHIERSGPKRTGKKVKSALPFDTYHVLTIDVGRRGNEDPCAGGRDHRSPREHLRRGHIRRLADGRRIWVNATVVGARNGVGVVTKDYKISGGSHGV